MQFSEIISVLDGNDVVMETVAMVWIDRPVKGSYVRVRDILRIEPVYDDPRVSSAVTVLRATGETEILLDQRRAKVVERARQRAIRNAAADVAEEILRRIGPNGTRNSGLPCSPIPDEDDPAGGMWTRTLGPDLPSSDGSR